MTKIRIVNINGNSVGELDKLQRVQSVEDFVFIEPTKTNQPDEMETVIAYESQDNSTKIEITSSALENLAKNIDEIGKHKDMNNDVTEMNMIAFKVFTPTFEKSDYIIGLVESVIGKNTSEQRDYELVLQIMGMKIKMLIKCMVFFYMH